jgi:hypothetical protein
MQNNTKKIGWKYAEYAECAKKLFIKYANKYAKEYTKYELKYAKYGKNTQKYA